MCTVVCRPINTFFMNDCAVYLCVCSLQCTWYHQQCILFDYAISTTFSKILWLHKYPVLCCVRRSICTLRNCMHVLSNNLWLLIFCGCMWMYINFKNFSCSVIYIASQLLCGKSLYIYYNIIPYVYGIQSVW